jgi:hypothetical protein
METKQQQVDHWLQVISTRAATVTNAIREAQAADAFDRPDILRRAMEMALLQQMIVERTMAHIERIIEG